MAESESMAGDFEEALGAAQDEAERIAEQQKNAGGDRLAGIGHALHKAADELAKEIPAAAAAPMHSAAEALEDLAGQLRQKNISDLASLFDSLARKQPVASFAGCVVVGFALTHFLKSSSNSGSR